MPNIYQGKNPSLPEQVLLNKENIDLLNSFLSENPKVGTVTTQSGSPSNVSITPRRDEAGDLYLDFAFTIEPGEQGSTGPEGPPGPAGPDIFTDYNELKIDSTDSTVTYISPKALITGARLIGYKTAGNEEIELAVEFPIKAGSGITVDAAEDGKSIEVKSGLYIHLIRLMSVDGQQYINFSLILNKSEPATNANMVEMLMNYYSNSTNTPIPVFGIIKISPDPKIVTVANSRDGYFTLSGYSLTDGNVTDIGNFIDLCQSFDTTDKVYPLGGS